jgi:hypothetical protein
VDADPTMTRPMTQRSPTSTRRKVDIEMFRPAMRMPVPVPVDEPEAEVGVRRT